MLFQLADKKNPHIGVIVKMSSSNPKYNCSLAVSVLCNVNRVQVRFLFFLSLFLINQLDINYGHNN